MADEELKLRITAEDGTAAALASVTQNFKREQAEIQRGVKRLSDGTKVNVADIQKQADSMGVSFKTMWTHLNSTESTAKRASNAIGGLGQSASGAGSAFTRFAGGVGQGSAALAVMGGRVLGVATAMEVLRRGIVSYAQFDTQLRLTQNQTGMLKSEINELSSEMKRLEIQTGFTKEELLKGFNELREAGRFTPEQTRKMFPDVALAIKGMGADVTTATAAIGHAMRNLGIPAEHYLYVLNATSHASQELQLDLGKMAGQMSRVSEAASAAGYKGVDGFQRMTTIMGIANEALGDSARAASVTAQMFEKMQSFELGKKLGFNTSAGYKAWLKQQKDQVGSVIDLMSRAENQTEIMEVFGIREIGVWRKLVGALGTYSDKLKEVRGHQNALAAGKNVADSLQTSYQALIASLSQLAEVMGTLLDATLITPGLAKLADVLHTMAEFAVLLVESLKWLFGQGDWPAKLPKSLGEAAFNMQVGKTREGKRVMEYDEYKAGGDPAKAKREYDEKMAKEDARLEAAKTKRREEIERIRREELRKKGLPYVPPEPGGVRPPLVAPQPRSSVPSIPPQVQKFGAAIEDSTKKLVAFTDELLVPEQAALLKAGLYGYGAGPSGTGTPGTGTGTGTAAVTPYGPPGTAYGGSSDSRFLRASYSPSGSVGGGGIGPGGAGTGYGGGTRGAMPYGGPAAPVTPGGRFDQPAPEGPGAPRRRGGPNAPPAGPPAPSQQGPGAPPEAPRGGPGGQRYNYFQRRGDAPIRDPKNLAIIDTKWGPMRVHPEAAEDFKKFYDKLAEADAPVGTSGTYNLRQKRWGGGWSSHAYGAAHDIGNAVNFSPAMKKWILANPEKWKEALESGNLGQPLTDPSMVGGKDPAHVEWRGPKPEQVGRQPAAPTGPGAPTAAAPGDAQSQAYQAARDAAVKAGIPDPDTAAAIAMHESGWMKRGTGSVFDRSGGTNPFGQTVRPGTPGAVTGRDRQPHATYGSLQEGFEAHYKRWGEHYRRGGTPDDILRSMVGGGYNVVDPNWRNKVAGIRGRMARPTATADAPSVGSGGRGTSRAAQDVDQTPPAEAPAAFMRTDGMPKPDDPIWQQLKSRGAPGWLNRGPVKGTTEENYEALKKQLEKNPQWGYGEDENVPGHDVWSGRGDRAHPLPSPGAIKDRIENKYGDQSKDVVPDDWGATERKVNLDLKVNDTEVQFARASMRRQADREVREARWNSYSDIGAA